MTITRNLTQPLTSAIARAITQPGAGGGVFSPDASFFAGSMGVALDFTAPELLAAATNGTGAVSANNDPVRYIKDLSGNGKHATVAAGITFKTGPNRCESPGIATATPAMDFTGTQKVTVIYAWKAQEYGGTGIPLELSANFAGNAGAFAIVTQTGGSTNLRLNGATGVSDISTASRPDQELRVDSFVLDLSGVSAITAIREADINGIAGEFIPVAGGTTGGGNFGNYALYIGARSGDALGRLIDLYRVIVIGRELTESELRNAKVWASCDGALPMAVDHSVNSVSLGDSIVAAFTPTPARDCTSFIPALDNTLLAVQGETIEQQQARFEALASYDFSVVFVQVGVNNITNGESSATIIGRLQTLLDSINARVPAACNVYLAKISPIGAGISAPQEVIRGAVNTAIGDGTITGADRIISAHVALMGDGTNNLAARYDTGDGKHPTDQGRAVNALAWRLAAEADGVLPATSGGLVFDTMPSGGASGAALGTQPVIRVIGTNGLVDSAFNGAVTATLVGPGVLSGTATVNAASGVATFAGLTVTGAGTHALGFTASGYGDTVRSPLITIT